MSGGPAMSAGAGGLPVEQDRCLALAWRFAERQEDVRRLGHTGRGTKVNRICQGLSID